MNQHSQAGDLRVNRANILRRIGRVSFESGGQPGLPAPHTVTFTRVAPLSIELHFDTAAEAAEWCERHDLHRREWIEGSNRVLDGYGMWEGFDISVRGWAPVDTSAPADTDPDDLSAGDHASIEDAPPRGSDAAEHREPVPADVEGIAAGRHHDSEAGA